MGFNSLIKKLFGSDVKESKIDMYVCPNCNEADDVWFDTKGEMLNESIYYCKKCSTYFSVRYTCAKCGEPHGVDGCSNPKCSETVYTTNHKRQKIKRQYSHGY